MARPGHLNDIGQWLGQTFKVGFSKLLPCVGLTLLGLIPAIFFYGALFLSFSDASTGVSGELEGINVALLAFSILLLIVWMLSIGAVFLAINHLLYEGHLGMPTSIGRSVQAAMQSLGRFIWAYLTLLLFFLAGAVVLAVLTFVAGLVSETLAGIVFVIAYLAFLGLSVWLSVKLVFLWVASAVAPDGQRPLTVSLDTTAGYFWAILGRLLLLGVVMSVAFVPVMFVLLAVIGGIVAAAGDTPGSGSSAGLFVSLGIGLMLYMLAVFTMQIFSQSGIARLYMDLGGPSRQLADRA